MRISVASGKGGVGKTLIAANFARVCATRRRCLLIDLDLQNQGCSGLLASYLRSGCTNTFDILNASEFNLNRITRISDNLSFIPAFDPGKTDRFSLQKNPMFMTLGLASLHDMFLKLEAVKSYEVIIVDCHGGLDDLSFSAFIESDYTFLITEPDKVTFNGTLELLDYYYDRSHDQLQNAPGNVLADATIHNRLANIKSNNLILVVNRSTGKYEYHDLLTILNQQLTINIPDMKEMNKKWLFIPTDPFLAESFSEYPFFVEILPESIFCQKMELLHRTIFSDLPLITGRSAWFRRFERLRQNKLERRLSSAFEYRVRTVFSYISIVQFLIMLSFVATVWIFVYFPLKGASNNSGDKTVNFTSIESLFHSGTILMSLGIGIMIFLIYSIRINIRLNGFYRDRWRYERRLWRLGGRSSSLVFLLRVLSVLGYRISAWFFIVICAVYTLSVAIMVAEIPFGLLENISFP